MPEGWRPRRQNGNALVESMLDGRPDAALDVAAGTAPASGLFLESVRCEEKK